MKRQIKKPVGTKSIETTPMINQRWGKTLKNWFKKGIGFTIEESKALRIRAQEVGRLTKLNAKKYKLGRDHENICAEIGQHVLELSTRGKNNKILETPKVQGLIEKANHIEKEMRLLEEEIGYYKKECDNKVKEIHRKAA